MITDRANAICLLEILREYSDEKNILQMKDIISKMNTIYGIHPDRRTIYSALALLIDLGYDISIYEENGVGYYLRGRELEQSEILLLTDAVYSFPFIPAKQSEQLIRKLQKQLSINQRKQYKHLTVVRQEKKTNNKQVFYNIDILDEAIEKKVKVKFDYCDYGVDKQLHKRRDKKYTVNPYGMVYDNEHYYLICIMAKQTNLSMYRIDRIQNIEITDYELDECESEFDPKQAVKNTVYAHTGEIDTVEMLVDPKKLNDVIDKFGTNITIGENDDGRLKITVKASLMGMKYWALQYMEFVEILNPYNLRSDLETTIKSNCYYNKQRGVEPYVEKKER